MGSNCSGCAGQSEEGELYLKARNKKIVQSKFDPNSVKYDAKDEQSIIRIQAQYKGAKTRQDMKSGDIFKKMLVDEPGLIFKDEVVFNNGSTYKGQCKQDGENFIKHGYGVLSYPDGAKYQGYFKDDFKEGRGLLVRADGNVYEGNFSQDKASGFGIFKNKELNSQGKLVIVSKYQGEWKDDKYHGCGMETWNDNSSYVGVYTLGKKEGIGHYVWPNGNSYKGYWSNNQITSWNGFNKGVYQWSDGKSYTGEWNNNMMEGKGTYKWLDGRVYHGLYHEDKKHGFGVYIYQDGRAYLGQWTSGKQDSERVYILPNGTVRKGRWEGQKKLEEYKELPEAEIENQKQIFRKAQEEIDGAITIQKQIETQIDTVRKTIEGMMEVFERGKFPDQQVTDKEIQDYKDKRQASPPRNNGTRNGQREKEIMVIDADS